MMSRMRKFSGILLILAVASGGGYYWWSASRDAQSVSNLANAAPTGSLPLKVHLSNAKQEAAHLVVEPVEVRKLQPRRWVPARATYDQTRHIEIVAPTDGVIRELAVRPGDSVSAGQVVALVDSPEIGERRADVLQLDADWRLAVRERDNAQSVQKNLKKLLQQLDQDDSSEPLIENFAKLPLGEFREPIFGAFSRLQTAEQLLLNLRPLADQKITSGRLLLEQQSSRDIALSAFRAARENAEIQADLKVLRTENAAADAARRLSIARERLASLTGVPGLAAEPPSSNEPLSHWPVRSPIAGTVETLRLAVGERIPQGQGLLVIADTSALWVEAELRERDWAALRVQQMVEVQVEFPAVPGRRWPAKVVFVGRTQAIETRAIPVVAQVENSDGLLRPGMFARVALAEGLPRESLVVPATAIMEHNHEKFVFVEQAPGEFERFDVKTGVEADDLVALEQGPAAGQRVVTQGGFYLKSELLLEPEE